MNSSSWPESEAFWKNKRILVSGGAGFLGGFVVEKLRERGASDVFIPRSKDYNLVYRDAVLRLISDVKPDIVIHLAARVGGIGANREHPASFFYDNLMMGVHLMHESWKAGVEKFIALGTVCAYPKLTPIPFKEESLWDGYPEETNAPYGLAKKMLLVQSESYRQEYGFNSVFLLPVNLYGPRDNFDLNSSHVIPALIRKCVDAKLRGLDSISVWGDGSATREFLYVEDAAEAILLASERLNESIPVNIGSSFEISIKDLTETIVQLVGFDGRIEWDTSKPNGQPRRKLDTSRAKELFGFESRISFEDGLRRSIDWYLNEYQPV